MNIFDARIENNTLQMGETIIAAIEMPDQAVKLGIRPEHFVPSPTGAIKNLDKGHRAAWGEYAFTWQIIWYGSKHYCQYARGSRAF